jgi:hypothetical protein
MEDFFFSGAGDQTQNIFLNPNKTLQLLILSH